MRNLFVPNKRYYKFLTGVEINYRNPYTGNNFYCAEENEQIPASPGAFSNIGQGRLNRIKVGVQAGYSGKGGFYYGDINSTFLKSIKSITFPWGIYQPSAGIDYLEDTITTQAFEFYINLTGPLTSITYLFPWFEGLDYIDFSEMDCSRLTSIGEIVSDHDTDYTTKIKGLVIQGTKTGSTIAGSVGSKGTITWTPNPNLDYDWSLIDFRSVKIGSNNPCNLTSAFKGMYNPAKDFSTKNNTITAAIFMESAFQGASFRTVDLSNSTWCHTNNWASCFKNLYAKTVNLSDAIIYTYNISRMFESANITGTLNLENLHTGFANYAPYFLYNAKIGHIYTENWDTSLIANMNYFLGSLTVSTQTSVYLNLHAATSTTGFCLGCNLTKLYLKGIGTASACTDIDLRSASYTNQAALVYTLVTNSYDRVSAGYTTACGIKLLSTQYSKLSTANVTAIQAKGYSIAVYQASSTGSLDASYGSSGIIQSGASGLATWTPK